MATVKVVDGIRARNEMAGEFDAPLDAYFHADGSKSRSMSFWLPSAGYHEACQGKMKDLGARLSDETISALTGAVYKLSGTGPCRAHGSDDPMPHPYYPGISTRS